jgi:arylsulfatase A-like enzyme
MSEAGTGRDTTPFLSALSRKGLYVPKFVTHFGTTYFSLMSMLQSRRNVAEALERQSPTLMGVLKASGYLTGILGDFETGSGLAGIVDSFRLATDRPSDRVLLNRGLDIMRRHRDAPFALWMHLDGPHIQTELEPAYQNLFADNAAFPSRYPDLRRTPIWKERIELLASERERIVLDYDRRLRQTDDLLRGFWAAAEKEGLLGNTLVVVSADHGEDLFTHHPSFRGHGTLYDTVLSVPLIWVEPGGSRGGGRLDRAVPAVDLAPSILTALGIAVPEQFEGRSFLPDADRARAPRDFILGRQPCTNGMVYALRSDRHKLIWSPSGCQPSYPEGYTYTAGGELYDLLSDPGEHRNLIAAEPELADHLRRQVRELTAAPPRDARGRLALEQKLQDVLRMAGYVR